MKWLPIFCTVLALIFTGCGKDKPRAGADVQPTAQPSGAPKRGGGGSYNPGSYSAARIQIDNLDSKVDGAYLVRTEDNSSNATEAAEALAFRLAKKCRALGKDFFELDTVEAVGANYRAFGFCYDRERRRRSLRVGLQDFNGRGVEVLRDRRDGTLKAGDVIRRINGRRVLSRADALLELYYASEVERKTVIDVRVRGVGVVSVPLRRSIATETASVL